MTNDICIKTVFAAAGALLIGTILALILILFKFADAQTRYFSYISDISVSMFLEQCNAI